MQESFLRRNQKLIWYLIAIPLLLTFSVTGSMYMIFERRKPEVLATFELPSGRMVTVDRAMFEEFGKNLRALSFGSDYGTDDLYTFLMLYHAAEEAGVRAPESQVLQAIRQFFPDKDSYDRMLSGREYGLTRKDFERYVGRRLMAGHYLGMLHQASAVPDGDEIVKIWQRDHEEAQVDYATLSAAEIRKGIDPDAVAEEDLRAHFDGMGEPERNRKFRREAKIAIEGLTLRVSEADESKFASLLEGEEFPETDLRLFYNQNLIYRFKRPEEPGEISPKEGEEAQAPPSPFYSFEEAKERVLRELKLKRALEKLLLGLKEQSGKENFSWEKFGEPFGLEYFAVEEPKTRSELATLERYGAALIANQAFAPGEGEFSDIVALAADDFYLYRIARKIPEGIPPFEEIRQGVLDDYLDKRSMDLAREKAKAFHESLLPAKAEEVVGTEEGAEEKRKDEAATVSEEAFRDAAKAHGVEIRRLDFFPKTPGLEFWKQPESPEKFLKRYSPLFQIQEGGVSQPIEDLSNRSIYVVRVLARRLPDASEITARDFDEAKRRARGAFSDPEKNPFAFENLKRAFHLQIAN